MDDRSKPTRPGQAPDGPWRELLSVGILVAASVLVDPVQRRNARLAVERAGVAIRRAVDGPPPRLPAPWELAALHDEARRITREAAPDG